jgi:hypothetical protein
MGKSRRVQQSNDTFNTNPNSGGGGINTGMVLDVILDDTNPRVETYDFSEVEKKNTSIIGCAAIKKLSDPSAGQVGLKVYRPFSSDEGLPLVGETVELIKLGGKIHYKRISASNINTGNAVEDVDIKNFQPTQKSGESKASELNTNSKTGTPAGGSGTDDRKTKIGKYFTPNQVNPLKFYEGDKIIQSRFSQSIRFSGYNNQDNVYAPTIIIRNRQSSESLNSLKKGSLTEEDINKDGTIIAITSGGYKLNFQSPLETKPSKFEKYPSELKGYDQVLVNSERIILSAKTQEMIFFSKGNYGFISDGKMSIDNGKAGADLDFNGDVRITTNDNSTYILGGKGNIFLNTESDAEPLVRGETLKGLLEELIDAINKQVFKTPSGPTAIGPENKSTFNDIKGRLDKALSTLNFTE